VSTRDEPKVFDVGPWRVEPPLNSLTRNGHRVRVERKVMQLLVVLASRPGESVARQHLLDTLWGYHVSDDALHTVVAKLRKALDMGETPAIETVPKVGYRLVLPVTGGVVTAKPSGDPPAPAAGVPRRAAAIAVVCVAAAGLAWWAIAAAPSPEVERSRLTPLTSERGLEVHPALSPGPGDRLAYAARAAGTQNWDLFVRGVASGQTVPLTSSAAQEFHPVWSPDAAMLAFVRYDAGACSLWTVSPLGGDERRIGACPGDDVASLGWDGRAALIVSARPESAGPFTIYRVGTDDAVPVALSEPPDGSIGDVLGKVSPDGGTLAVAFSPALGVQDMYVVPTAGGERRRLTHDDVKIHGFDWTPDSSAIVFSSNRAGLFGLWRASVTGAAPLEQLAATGDDLDAPSVSAGGARIAYERWLTESSVHELLLDGQTESTSRLAFTRWVWHVDMAPEDGGVVVVSDRSGSPELWTSGLDGSAPIQRSRFGGPYLSTPRWSPDGQRIAFIANGRLRVLDLASSAVIDPAADADGTEARHPHWSRDGRHVYFASNRSGSWQIWRVSADGGAATAVTSDGGIAMHLSPDGRTMYFTKPGANGIWMRAVDGSGPGTLVVPMLAPVDHVNWDVTSGAIFYIRRVAERAALHRYDLTDRSDRLIRPLDDLFAPSGLAVADDERRMWFVRIDRQDSDIMLLEWPDTRR
jgi:Tol biopolymer transport system component/DNA-binding winged helix-turn-helix (wHTH) protein